MNSRKNKFIVLLILSSILAGQIWFAAEPGVAHAQGGLSSIPTRVDFSKAQTYSDIAKAAGVAAMNSAFRQMQFKIEQKLQDTFGIKSFLLYKKALVEAKYLTDSYRSQFGSNAVTATSTAKTAEDFEGLPLNTDLTRDQARTLAVRGNRGNTAARTREIQRLVVGASTLFTSAIACGGINERALQNTAEYLAAASAGVLAKDINPRNRYDFYRSVSRFGSPYSSPEFWKLQLKQIAAERESEANQAAQNELTAPGLKAPQDRDARGRLVTGKSLNFITAGQSNTQNALINLSIDAGKNPYDTSSFKGFVGSLAGQLGQQIIGNLFGRLLGGILGDNFQEFQQQAAQVGSQIARGMATTLTTRLYDDLSQQLFQGQVIAESTGCGQRSRLRDAQRDTFTPNLDNDNAIPPAPPPPDDGGDGSGESLGLSIQPQTLERNRKARVSWDASLVSDVENGGVSVLPVPGEDLDIAGQMCFNVEDVEDVTEETVGTTIPIRMFVDTSGDTVQKNASVDVTEPVTRNYSFAGDAEICPGETTTIGWDVEEYPNAVIKLNGSQVEWSDEREVGIGSYNISVEEANGCGLLISSSVSVSRKPLIPPVAPATESTDPCAEPPANNNNNAPRT